MADLQFNERLVVALDEPGDYQSVERTLADTLLAQGYVKDTYAHALAEREKLFPTALEVGEVNVAIPHCDTEHVNEPAVCVGLLKKPVAWRRMDDPDATCDVSLVFMLALNEPHDHLAMIQKIVGIIQDQELSKKVAANSAAEAYELIAPRLD